MKKLDLNDFKKYRDYLVLDKENIEVVFSTAEAGKSFNRNTVEGIATLNNLKTEFNVDKVIYLRQVHSDTVFLYNGEDEKVFIENEGDAIITNKKNVAIGVFTADCVPIILVDYTKKVIAAIHSGWKGTFKSIVKRTIEKMCNEFGCNINSINVFIGAHIRKCCYEVSVELKEEFLNKTKIEESILCDGRKISMEECIVKDLRDSNIPEENINILGLCTYCSEEIKLHSYRKSDGAYGRLFAFVINK